MGEEKMVQSMISKIKDAVLLVLLSALFLFMVSRFMGCRSAKEITTEKIVVDSTSIKESEKLRKALSEIQEKHQKEIQELSESWVAFENTECDTIIIDSSCNVDSAIKIINALKNTVKKYKDGTIEIEGKIKSYKEIALRTDKEATEISIRNEQLESEVNRLKTELSKTSLSQTKQVKRKFGLNMTLIIIALVVGIIIGIKFKEKLSLLFNLFKKK